VALQLQLLCSMLKLKMNPSVAIDRIFILSLIGGSINALVVSLCSLIQSITLLRKYYSKASYHLQGLNGIFRYRNMLLNKVLQGVLRIKEKSD